MISGLVVYLTADAELAQATLSAIAEQPNLELGAQEDRRLPVVLETETASESQSLTDWLFEQPGVEHVDVAFVHLDDSTPTVPTPSEQLD